MDWLKGLEAFHKTWFPEDAKEGRVVPGFWFGARKASYKSFFEKLEVECLEAARCLVSRMLLGGVFSQIFFICIPKIGEMIPIFT